MIDSTTALLIGGILAAFAVAAALHAAHVRGVAQAMIDTPTTPAGAIQQPGHYEVKGRVVCDSPLQAPRAGRACVYFRHVIEEERRTGGSSGGSRRTWVTIEDDLQLCPFHVEDESGRLAVYPQAAKIEGHRTEDTTRPSDGGFLGFNRLGWRETITAIYVGDIIYALGQIERHPDGLTMERGADEGRPFLLSVHSEEEQLQLYQNSFSVRVMVAVASACVSLLLLLYGLCGAP